MCMYTLGSEQYFSEWKNCYTRNVVMADGCGDFPPLFFSEEAANEYLKLKSKRIPTSEFVVKIDIFGSGEDFSCSSCGAKVEAEHRFCWRCGHGLVG